MTFPELRKLATSLPEVVEAPHFEKTSFRIKGKIFLTFDENAQTATVKLSETDQDIFCKAPGGIFTPVNNKWGKQGWTTVHLLKADKRLVTGAITAAYCEVAPKKLAEAVRST